jgi:putative ABC transport system permease protein
MILNYFHIALRNLTKSKVHTVINVAGLALGIASVFLITLYIQSELSYDRFHHDSENLYRITWEDDHPQTRTPHPMAQALASDFPEVESAVSLSPLWAAGLTRETHSFRNLAKEVRYDEKNILSVDTTFFQVFDFPLLIGDPKTALKQTGGLLISESMAKKYFGDENPMGKQLSVDSDTYMVEVVGVFKDVPVHSHFHFDFLVSYVREKSLDSDQEYYSWRDFGHYNYIRLKPGADAKQLEVKLMDWTRKYLTWSDQDYQSLAVKHYSFRLQPVTDIHLHSKLHWELEPNGNIEYIYILGAAALLTLIIACVNFMNLTTAKSAERAKEIGVRKTLGAFRSQLAIQFLAESVTLSVLSILIGIILVEGTLPFFNAVSGLTFQINYTHYLAIFLFAGIFIGLLSGLYPSLYLSGVKPHLVLKGKLTQSPRGSGFRKGLIVFQFSMSMILICASVIVFKQLNFLKNKNLGFGKEEIVIIPVKNERGMAKFETLRNELLKIDGITAVTASSNIPGHQFNQHPLTMVNHPEDVVNASEALVDYDFFQALDIPLTEGRVFLRDNTADSSRTFVINETAARQLNFDGSIIGKEINWNNDGNLIRGTVVGVVKDFHFQSLHEPIRPLLFVLEHRYFNYVMVKLNTEHFDKKIAAIEKTYKQAEPIFGFEFAFMEDDLNTQYNAEQRTGNILAAFSAIAMFIACFGLFGMSMLTFHQKIKEVSVRKVLGASAINLVVLLLGNFTKLILLAIVLAVPVAWWVMREWLTNFSYQVEIDLFIFIIAGASLLIISWVTLLYFTLRSTRLNPADTLKTE